MKSLLNMDPDPLPQDYNLCSSERRTLFETINAVLHVNDVSPAFWAVCQLADIERLKAISHEPVGVLIAFNSIASQIMTQCNTLTQSMKRATNIFEGNQSAREPQTPSTASEWNCKLRENDLCILTKSGYPQGAHIYPFCLLDANRNQQSERNHRFWDLLSIFWTKEHIQRWRQAVFTDSATPDTGVDSCTNILCLCPNAHTYWNEGLFALKPLNLSPDNKELKVQFFWQPRYKHNPGNKIKILTNTVSSEGLDGVDEDVFLCRKAGATPAFIRSGDCFTFKTDDPIERPLPSIDLLDMQWTLQRLVGMSGAAGWVPLDDDSESETSRLYEDYDHLLDENGPDPKRVCYGDPRVLNTSLHSLDGILDWIPPPDKVLPPGKLTLSAVTEEPGVGSSKA